MSLTVAQLVARLTADTSGFYRAMALANSSMIRTGSVISRVSAGIGLATLGIGIVSVRAAGNFEQSMNILQATIEPTGKQFDSLKQKAIDLGRDLKLPNVSARDASDAMVELGKGGLSVNQVLKATRGTLQLGLAANIGFADSAQIVARTLKNFGLEGNKATMISNLLAAGANKSTAEITDLAYGLQNAGGQFAASGMSVNTLVVALSELADKGLSGEYAGTALKTMLVRLSAPTKEAAAVMKDYGIKIFDAAGRMKTMPQIIQNFQDSFKGATQQQKLQALTTIFGVRANQAMIKLMQGGVKEWNKYKDAIVGTDAAQKLTEARTKGFNGALQGFSSAVETLAIELGSALLPSLTKLVRGMTNFILSIKSERVIGFFSAIKDGIVWIKSLASAIPGLGIGLKAVAAGFAAFLVVKSVISLVMGLRMAVMALNLALMANPVALVIGALVALGVALYMLYQRSETFRNIVQAVFGWMQANIPPILDEIKNAVMNFVAVVLALWDKFGDTILSVAKTMLSFLTATFRNLFQVLQGIWNTFAGIFTGDWSRVWTGIKQIFSGIWSQIGNTLKTWLSVLSATAGAIGMAILNKIVSALSSLARGVAGKFADLWAWIKGAANTAKDYAVDVGNAIVRGIINGLRDILSAVWREFQKLWTWIKGLPGYVFGLAKEIGSAIVNGILDGLKGLAGKVGGAIKDGIGGAFGAAKGFLGIGSPSKKAADEIGKPIADGIIVGYILGIKAMPTTMKATLQQAITNTQVAMANAAKVIGVEQARAIVKGFAETEQTITQRIKAALAQAVRDALAEARQKVVDARSAFMSAFGSLADAALAAFDASVDAWVSPTRKMLEKMRLREQIKQLKDDILQAGREVGSAAEAYNQAGRELIEAQASGDPERIAAAEAKVKEAYDALQKAYADYQAAMQAKREFDMERQAEREEADYAKRKARERLFLQQRLTQLMNELAKDPKAYKKVIGQVEQLLEDHGVTTKVLGTAAGIALAAGLNAAEKDVRRAAKALAQAIADELQITVNVTVNGKKGQGKGQGGQDKGGVLGPASRLALSSAFGPAGLSGQSPVVNNYITVEGSVRSDRDFALVVRDILSRRSEANANLVFRH